MPPTPTSPMPDLDALIDDTTVEQVAREYPLVQWINGGRAKGVTVPGRLIIPFFRERQKGSKTTRVANIPEDFMLPGFTKTTYTFDSGKVEPVLAASEVWIAIIRFRRCWFRLSTVNGRRTAEYRAYNDYADGFRGKYQILIVFKGVEAHPFALTLTGTNSREFFDAFLPALDATVGKVGAALGLKKRLPRLAVWAHLKVGDVVTPNDAYTTQTTPPLYVQPAEDSDPKTLFVGRDNLIAFQAVYKEAEAWVKAWDTIGQNAEPGLNGRGPRPPMPELPASADEDDF